MILLYQFMLSLMLSENVAFTEVLIREWVGARSTIQKKSQSSCMFLLFVLSKCMRVGKQFFENTARVLDPIDTILHACSVFWIRRHTYLFYLLFFEFMVGGNY